MPPNAVKLRPALVAVLVLLVYAGALAMRPGGAGVLAWVTLGTRFSDGDPTTDVGSEGYDGQFVYYIAREPLAAAPYLDVPAYRYQRILLSALAWLFSGGGNAALVPYALLAINAAALGAAVLTLERLLVGYQVSRWYALGLAFSLGMLGAARLSLPEPLAYALALAGVAAALDGRVGRAALWFALAALAKETTLILAAGVGAAWAWQALRGAAVMRAPPLPTPSWSQIVGFGAAVLAPFFVWQLVLFQRFGTWGVGSGGALATQFERVPFGGVVRIFTEGGAVVLRESGAGAFVVFTLIFAVTVGVFALVPTMWGLVRVWRDLRTENATLVTWLLAATSLIMLFVPFSTYREPLGILRFIVGLQIAVIVYAAARRKRRTLRYTVLWMVTSLFVVGSDFTAPPG